MSQQYIPDMVIDDNISNDTERKEADRKVVQEKHYFMLSQLQDMAGELPAKYQQRLPYDLLSGLASALLDGTVFQIVHGLTEIQQMTERNLFNQRMSLLNTYKTNRQDILKKQKEAIQASMSRPHNIPVVEAKFQKDLKELDQKHEADLNRTDMKLILELDQKVSDQQVTLEKAGVPGFFVTNNPQEVRVQMYQLDFIIRLGNAIAEMDR
ncbi:PREDICTED: protein DGCR6-like isoform X1 [Priapulus caudatus]|uniref:Protein DGCR6-like isoform X1 n=1 Tax=Priapulus caudatus TaxID=37621 RepID=A0ABM1DTX1_PRICU|nr:PREDICTED: protein DGCR6-like isoform X1 [Priapulus caudatus]